MDIISNISVGISILSKIVSNQTLIKNECNGIRLVTKILQLIQKKNFQSVKTLSAYKYRNYMCACISEYESVSLQCETPRDPPTE